ncbi:MAG: transglycosylase SLT domain-containing protein [Dysgonamonadaceae bacterium]|jgi:membrane-bound lytic murein transglycosylase D|nr:transglycosylase SLT domain-containing protein [Dysgonamonadaceae bacterium]
MKKLLTGFILCFASVAAMNAQVENNSLDIDSLDTDVFFPENFESNIDSLLNSWHVQYYVKQHPRNNTGVNIQVSDAVYKDRLSKLPHIIEMPYNEVVRKCIDMYIHKRRTIEYMLGLADFYFPMIEQTLDENQLPLELKYLAIVESALNPTAVSRAGATGLWQFMLPTGKAYGLEINSLVDDRRDPVKATYAACRYFKDMYDIYGDWHLVIAAYNCGAGNVNKAIRRAGGKRDYWAIYNYLPRETRSYVPLFIAANYAMNYYDQHGLIPVSTSLPLATDTVMVNELLHLEQVAQTLNVDIEMLRALNPQYKRDIVPGNNGSRVLLLPVTDASAFAGLGDSIYRYKQEEFFVNRDYVVPGVGGRSSGVSNQERIVHRVKNGETMGVIANRYGVTVAQVRKWNGLKSSRVGTGTKLTLYVDNGGIPISDQASTDSENTPTTVKSTSNAKAPATAQVSGSAAFTKYKVKPGDTFSSISQKYPGVSVKRLMEFNNTNNPKLVVGQIIKIPTV